MLLNILCQLGFLYSYSASAHAIPIREMFQARSAEVIAERIFARQAGAQPIPLPNFSYVGETGPVSWANINETYAMCATGGKQSPINIQSNIPIVAGLVVNVPALEEADIENLGSTVEVILKDMGTLTYAGTTYSLQQLHFHTPSEHRVEGIYYDLEMHMVFKSATGQLAVLASVYNVDIDQPQVPYLDSIFKNLAAVQVPGTESKTGPIDLSPLVSLANGPNGAWSYTGSLTAPPCTEGVMWFVVAFILPINVPTFKALRNIQGFNARYTQADQSLGQNLLANICRNPEVVSA